MAEAGTIVFYVVVSIMVCGFVPFGIYCSYKIWNIRNEPFFQKRYPKLTILSLLWISIWCSICFPLDEIEDFISRLGGFVATMINYSLIAALTLVLID